MAIICLYLQVNMNIRQGYYLTYKKFSYCKETARRSVSHWTKIQLYRAYIGLSRPKSCYKPCCITIIICAQRMQVP